MTNIGLRSVRPALPPGQSHDRKGSDMHHRKISVMVAIGLVIGLVGAIPAVAATPHANVLQISDANLKALTSTMGGAQALPTSRTVPHWWGSTVNPDNGVTYGYNMVGADPNNCSGSACDV